MYKFLNGTTPFSMGNRYLPNLLWVGQELFDYHFLQSVGPYRLYNGDTLLFVFVFGVGERLSGGCNSYWFNQLILKVRNLPWIKVRLYDVCGRLRSKGKFVTSLSPS